MASTTKTPEETTQLVRLPAPTSWPIVLAFGITLLFAGLVTTAWVAILGGILAIRGCVGWFREVLPEEKHELLAVSEITAPVTTARPSVARVDWLTHQPHRARLPLEIYPISAGVKGGLTGCVAMAALAILYGIVFQHSVWYPINLLSAGFFPETENTVAQLKQFQWLSLLVASAIHLTTSLLVGLLYGAMLPMFPRRPILLGGVIAPVLWSALIYSMLEVVDPLLSKEIDWPWFVVSQMAFGVIAGLVVSKQIRVRTWQSLPFPVRAGFEAPGTRHPDDQEDVSR